MLDSLYERTLYKKETINKKFRNSEIKSKPANFWKDWQINEDDSKFTICGGDGSFNKIEFRRFMLYAIGAECLIYDSYELKNVQSCEVDILPPYGYNRERLENYMSILEMKTNLKALEEYDIDIMLFDGSILGNIIRPPHFMRGFTKRTKDEIIKAYLPALKEKIEESSSDLSTLRKDLKEDIEPMIYLEYLEKLLVIYRLIEKKRKIVAISKRSTSNRYFRSNIPDMAIFEEFSNKEGYSKPKYLEISDIVKWKFPTPELDRLFRGMTFTIFYVRLEDFKNILKFELPYRLSESGVRKNLEKVKKISTDGYPYLLKRAHDDVIIRDGDMERISKILGLFERTGREML